MNVTESTKTAATTNTHPVPSAMMDAAQLYALISAGYEPIGVVIGVAAISMGARGFGRSIRGLFNRGEMTAVSQTSTEARQMAVRRAEEHANELGASLFLVSHLEVRDVAEIVEVTCMGTALKKTERGFTSMPIATATS